MKKKLTLHRLPLPIQANTWWQTKLSGLLYVLIALQGACQHTSGKRNPADRSSQVSTIMIDEFVPKDANKQWNTMQLQITKQGSDKPTIDMMVERTQFQSGNTKDIKVTVPYGLYKILLTYYQNNRDVSYQSCEEEQKKEHKINMPTYPVNIDICPFTGSKQDPNTGPLAPNANLAGINPFERRALFVNPKYRESVENAALQVTDQNLKSKMLKLRDTPTAIWIDRIAAIPLMEPALKTARNEMKAQSKSVIVTFVIYNLPERDCAAYASAGELTSSNRGLERYKDEYIGPIKNILQTYQDVPTALIIEPDSLPNLATNLGVPKCAAAQTLYRDASAYAIKNLSLPHTALYLDTAHGGWLGWPDNLRKMAQIFKEVLDQAGGPHLIRGFASNVSNYSPTTLQRPDPNPEAYYQYNPSRDELTFIANLNSQLEGFGITGKKFVIDTSRNGQPGARQDWGNWCNIKGAGLGERPTVTPASLVDAYLWIKPPGESDGISDSSQKRFDVKCVSNDSMLGAPEAGQWFQEHFKTLVQKAQPPL